MGSLWGSGDQAIERDEGRHRVRERPVEIPPEAGKIQPPVGGVMKTSMFRWNVVFVSLVLLSAGAWAQTRPTAPPSGPTAPTRPTAPTSIPSQPQQRQPQMTRPIFIMGDVVTGDGTDRK